jgi:hypothetical protein
MDVVGAIPIIPYRHRKIIDQLGGKQDHLTPYRHRTSKRGDA